MFRKRDILYTFPAVMIIFSLLYAILSWTCSSLPFSHFYRHDHRDGGIHEENSRLQNHLARQYLRSVFDDDFAGLLGMEVPSRLAVVIITAPRRGPGYLARSLASLHLELKEHYVEHPVPINVCFSDAEEHNELSSLLPLPSLFILHNFTSPLLQSLVQNKEVFSTLFSTINLHRHRLSVPWLDIKLYKAARLRGWAWDWIPLLQLSAYSALLGMVLEFVLRGPIQ